MSPALLAIRLSRLAHHATLPALSSSSSKVACFIKIKVLHMSQATTFCRAVWPHDRNLH